MAGKLKRPGEERGEKVAAFKFAICGKLGRRGGAWVSPRSGTVEERQSKEN